MVNGQMDDIMDAFRYGIEYDDYDRYSDDSESDSDYNEYYDDYYDLENDGYGDEYDYDYYEMANGKKQGTGQRLSRSHSALIRRPKKMRKKGQKHNDQCFCGDGLSSFFGVP